MSLPEQRRKGESKMGKSVRLIIYFLVIFFLVNAPVSQSQARLMKVPRYQELLDKSDLVVIAVPKTKTTDTEERAFLPGIFPKDKYIGTETIFSVAAVLKGDRTIEHFTLHHYRAGNSIEINGPSLVFFDQSDPARSGDYILFLVREADGRYAPTGGQTDPGYKVISKLPVAE